MKLFQRILESLPRQSQEAKLSNSMNCEENGDPANIVGMYLEIINFLSSELMEGF